MSIERMTRKHNEIVASLERFRARREKAIAALVRADAKLTAAIRAVGRSSKRLDRARAMRSLNAPLPAPTPGRDYDALQAAAAVLVAPSQEQPMGDDKLDIPEFLRRGAAAQSAVDAEVAAANQRIADQAERERFRQEQRQTASTKRKGADARKAAVRSGATKAMPAQGKDALKIIDGLA